MIRMEFACFMVLAFLSIIYFSSEREKTQISKIFSAILILSMVHLAFDGITVYTVNHLDVIPRLLNDIVHRLFIVTMFILFYLLYYYFVILIEEEVHTNIKTPVWSTVLVGITFLGVLFLPIQYIETPSGNYSFGPPIYALYAGVILNIFMCMRLFWQYGKQIHPKKKNGISYAIIIFILVSMYQAFHPLALLSGMAIMLIILALYLNMENPDIALLGQIEEEKKKADEANAAKSLFLSRMSHEIRTPMNAIVGMTEILLRTDMTEEQKDYLVNIKHSAIALVSIINDILDISKIEAGKMELIEDVYQTDTILSEIYGIINTRIGDKPIELIYELDEEMPDFLYGDGLRIRQVIINLLNNAAKFTETGYIKLGIKVKEKTVESIALRISVSDTGQGIRQEDLVRLFEAFEQVDTKKNKGKEGTGLGLSISKQLIEMMGGKLEVVSEYGEGSEFFFTIYQKLVSEDMVKLLENKEDMTKFIAPKAEILIVDDNEINRKVALGLLAPLQMKIETAENGKQALSMIQKKEYHMIFMDHMMPVMDGVEATKHLRKMEGAYYQNVPVIALTANAMKDAQELFRETGMNGFVAKPIDMKQICKVIREWLPKELVLPIHQEESITSSNQEEVTQIEGIDVKEGLKNFGTWEAFIEILGDYYKLIESKAHKIENCIEDGMIREYTIEVHGLKSASRIIGATELSKQFEELERLGNAENITEIQTKTPEVLTLYRSYKKILEPYGRKPEANLKEVSLEELVLYVQGIKEAIAGFDLDTADAAMKQLEACRIPECCIPMMEELRPLMADVAMEEIVVVTEKMIKALEEKK